MIETVVAKSRELIRAEYSALALFSDGELTGFYTSLEDGGCSHAAGGVLRRVYDEAIPVRVRDIKDAPGFGGLPPDHRVPIKSILVVPVILHGEVIGEILLANRVGADEFTAADEDLLLTLGFHAASVLDSARHHREVVRLATVDGLTGLNNHRTFQERLERELERARRYAGKQTATVSLLMMDIDYFKKLNDSYGHRAGDEVLKKIGAIIAENIRAIDIAARYGGEEFVAILPETTCQGAAATAERIRHAVGSTVLDVEGVQITLTLSIGVASFPEDATHRELLIETADRALYAAKHTGRNRVCTIHDIPSPR
jgi:diguanylate cyclase (GGDEF)-like protein